MPRYLVPSVASANEIYEVDFDGPHCTCPSFQHSGSKQWCKHLDMVAAKPDQYATDEDPLPEEDAPSPGLYTIGHSNHSLPALLQLLEQHRIKAVIDVRSSPYSKHSPHFRREALRKAVRIHGIDYFWAGKELGGRSPTPPITTPVFQGRMAQVVEMASRLRVALLCSEGKPKECHRAMKLTAYTHRMDPPVYAYHIERSGHVLDSMGMEAELPASWLWEDFEGGENR